VFSDFQNVGIKINLYSSKESKLSSRVYEQKSKSQKIVLAHNDASEHLFLMKVMKVIP
jgi:hypothetical protein